MSPRPVDSEGAAARLAVGAALRQAREGAGLSLRDVAERVGSSHAWLGGIESGRRALYAHDVPRLARALDLDPGDLFLQIREKLDATG